jgi:hypothetical protein
MSAHSSVQWHEVRRFTRAGDQQGSLDEAERVVSQNPGRRRRFESSARHRALLVPAVDVTVDDVSEPADVAEVMLIDPPEVPAARSLLSQLGDRAGSVGVALPEGAHAPGLVAVGTTVISAGATSIRYQVHRLLKPSMATLARGPKMGETPDVLENRGRWFGVRHGGAEGGH